MKHVTNFFIYIFAFSHLAAVELSPFIYAGGIGVLSMCEYPVSPLIELPSITLLDKDSKIGLEFIFSEFSEQEEFIFRSFITKLYWNPPLFGALFQDEFNILGLFVDLGFENNEDIKINLGCKFSLSISSDFFFDSFPTFIRMKALDIETGYSLSEKIYYASLKTDLLGVLIGIGQIYLENVTPPK